MPDPRSQSEGFRANRAARRNMLVEDYVELISDLGADGRQVRQIDMAGRLGVSQPTVAKMLARLSTEGLVVQNPCCGVALTDAGRTLAAETRARHRIVEAFLMALGVERAQALIDAEGIEHYVGEATLAAFQRALDRGLGAFMRDVPLRATR